MEETTYKKPTATRENQRSFNVPVKDHLLDFLFKIFPDRSRTTVKSYLTHRQVMVNNVITTKFNTILTIKDVVKVNFGRVNEAPREDMIKIIYEDEHIIVINKRHGVLSIATDKEQTKTAYHILSEHVKQSSDTAKIFIVHRLDRETSGIMLFAKSEQIKKAFQSNWNDVITQRKYVALVEGTLPEKKGEIVAPLSENKNFKVYVDPDGEPAMTRYEVLKSAHGFSLVELELETGKKNQIRAHMEYMRTPIVGDKKYGALTKEKKRVCLHARVLEFIHPVTQEAMKFSTAIPTLFEKF